MQTNKKQKIIVGLFVVQKRLRCKKYDNIFALLSNQDIEVIQMYKYFNSHWTKWPIVDVVISFKGGIPYVMILQYANKYQPLIINNLQNQQFLWDRVAIYDILQDLSIPVPKQVRIYRDKDYLNKIQKKNFGKIFNQDDQQVSYDEYMIMKQNKPNTLREYIQKRQNKDSDFQIEESQNFILIKIGDEIKKLQKPFVQKAFDARDHTVAFYYPISLGGGRRIIHRQHHGHTNTAQSVYQKPNTQIRRNQNYIYEEFLPTNAYDIKVYILGQFLIAESRRCPLVQTQKLQDKSEVRHQIQLTRQQIEYCKKISKRLGQQICALDILRTNQKSYVCDINGWGFANLQFLKDNIKIYWMMCADYLKNRIYEKLLPQKYVKQVYKTLSEYSQKYHNKVLNCKIINKEKQQGNQLMQVISIFGIQNKIQSNDQQQQTVQGHCNKQIQRLNEQFINKGEDMRINSYYDSGQCLSMLYKFEHRLVVRSYLQQSDDMKIGYFMKGYLNIGSQVSPAIMQMISKQREQQKQQDFKYNNKYGYNEIQWFRQNIYNQIYKYINNQSDNIRQVKQSNIKLKTVIYFKYRQQLRLISELIRQNIEKLLIINKKQYKQKNKQDKKQNKQYKQQQSINYQQNKLMYVIRQNRFEIDRIQIKIYRDMSQNKGIYERQMNDNKQQWQQKRINNKRYDIEMNIQLNLLIKSIQKQKQSIQQQGQSIQYNIQNKNKNNKLTNNNIKLQINYNQFNQLLLSLQSI